MKRLIHYLMNTSIFALALFVCSPQLSAQCPSGYSKFTLKWDYLDFFTYNGNYTAATGYLPNLAAAQTQNFAFGSSGRLTISHNYGQFAFAGDNANHTGETGSYGNGNTSAPDADVQFIGNGQITLTFDAEVNNVQFSLFDIDNFQQVNIAAANAAATAQSIDITTLGVTTLAVTGNHTTAPQVVSTPNSLGQGRNLATSSVQAAFNVDIAGPVKQVTITISNSGSDVTIDNGSFWLSDITACTPGAFPTNYYSVSKPYTNQPGYLLHALDNSVYAVNPANGVTKYLFTDASVTYINSMAYDPYNKVLYYVPNNVTPVASPRPIKKYDFTTETITTVLADVNSIGIPTSSYMGIEQGGAAFYNGSLYLGIQTTNSNSTSGRESVIWRIDFNASNVPYRSSQAYALPTDDGTGLQHAWGDFCIRDGVLFDSDASTNDPDIYQFDMSTGLATRYNGPGFDPGEITVDWAGNIYQLKADALNGVPPYIALYTEDGNIGTPYFLSSSPAFSPAIPNLGDAAEAFKPKADFGDAPASYDPSSSDPAVHEQNINLRLGNSWGKSWTKLATDPNDDGMGAAPALDYFGTTTYTINVNVFNNTGASATMVAWLDWNFDNVFQPSEGRLITVPSSATTQLVPLSWTMWVPYTANTNTWLRVRLTSASNGMTVNNINGYFADGEVEDYPVLMGNLLAQNILSFTANANSRKTVDLNWQLNTAPTLARTVVERSQNSLQWDSLTAVNPGSGIVVNYASRDENPYNGVSYYRIKLVFNDGSVQYSDIKTITLGAGTNGLQINLNPANQYTTLKISSSIATMATIDFSDNTGRLLLRKSAQVNVGDNLVRLSDLGQYASGIYYVHVKTTEFSAVEKLLIKHE